MQSGTLGDAAVRRAIFVVMMLVACAGVPVRPAMAAEQTATFYIAPTARGNGQAADTAAGLFDDGLWDQVRQRLQRGPVEVVLLPGSYEIKDTFYLEQVGHDDHRLTIRAQEPGQAVFSRSPQDQRLNDPSYRPLLFGIRNAKNVQLRGLRFTDDKTIGYAMQIRSAQNIHLLECEWIDLPGVYYGAAGTAGATTSHITFEKCTFERVGSGGHAHMIYNAYEPKHIYVIDSRFVDCAGDFIRFRDDTDYGVVFNCEFIQTGDFKPVVPPFVSMPLFNDDDPQNPGEKVNYEYFGTHFVIANNRFIYPDRKGLGSTGQAITFLHKGFSPPGRHHLLSDQQARVLEKGTPQQRARLLLETTGIDVREVHIYGNTFENETARVTFDSSPAYGAEKRHKGWSGWGDITDLMNPRPARWWSPSQRRN